MSENIDEYFDIGSIAEEIEELKDSEDGDLNIYNATSLRMIALCLNRITKHLEIMDRANQEG